MNNTAFNSTEKRTMLGIAVVIVLRMFGLFLVLPATAIFSGELDNSSPLLIGLAVGIYGLTQAFLQIPLGWLSDIFGRKPVILFGLVVFAMGSLLAAQSHSIEQLLVGRALQGAGAISAATMALLADLTREAQRTKAMAVLGMSIGAAFMLAFAVSPVLEHWIGVRGLFTFTAVLALVAGMVLTFGLPSPKLQTCQRAVDFHLADFASIFRHPVLWRLDFSIFCLHAVLAMVFSVVPLLMQAQSTLSHDHLLWLYAVVLALSFVAMLPLLILAERLGRTRTVIRLAIALLAVAQIVLTLMSHTLIGLSLGLFGFFAAFNILEALLPSWISKVAPSRLKGTALGVYSSSQFFGVFVGGSLSGLLMQLTSLENTFVAGSVLCLVWLLIAWQLESPAQLQTLSVPLSDLTQDEDEWLKKLTALAGVLDVRVSEQQVYIKVDKNKFMGLGQIS